MNHQEIRSSFPALLDRRRIVVDNAASTQVADPVLDFFAHCARNYANIARGGLNRGNSWSGEGYYRARNTAANLINAASWDEIVFVRNATEAINMVAYWIMEEIRDGDNIVITHMEHNSNFMPWKRMETEARPTRGKNIELRFVPFGRDNGELDLTALSGLVDDKTKLVGVTGASNVFGSMPRLTEISSIAHSSRYTQPDGQSGSYLLVDAAQLVPHAGVDVQAMGCDFLAWSYHKMTMPFGVGALYGKLDTLRQIRPLLVGGGMGIPDQVSSSGFRLKPWPASSDAGTPNVLGVVTSVFGVPWLANVLASNAPSDDPIEAGGDLALAEHLFATHCGGPFMGVAQLFNNIAGWRSECFAAQSERKAWFETWSTYLKRHSELGPALADPDRRRAMLRNLVNRAAQTLREHEMALVQQLMDGVEQLPGATILGTRNVEERTGLLSFSIDGYDPHALGAFLAEHGVEVRCGLHCADLLYRYADIKGSTRVSFYLYNDSNDAEAVLDVLRHAMTIPAEKLNDCRYQPHHMRPGEGTEA